MQGIRGATGAIHGLRLVEHLHTRTDIQVHLVISQKGVVT